MITFPNPEKNLMVQQGAILDKKNRDVIKDGLPSNNLLVEASRHTIISGPPGVGKTYGTIDECLKAGVKYITIAPGMTDAALIMKLAYHVARLADDEELLVILDDADDVIFSDYNTLNRWKIALADTQPELGIIPSYNHPVSMINTIATLRKQDKNDLADAVEKFMPTDSVGVSIPFDRVRVMILCNLDLEDPKSFSSKKMLSAVGPVVDRNNYQRIEANWKEQWGWLAYVLSNTQPFEDYSLEESQKKELLNWMYSNWDNMRSTSYRSVLKLAADMINFPDDYETKWETKLRSNKHRVTV